MKQKLQILLIISLIIIVFSQGYSQAIQTENLYLGQTPPGDYPKIFKLSVTNGLRPVERIAITSDGKEIYYTELDNWPATKFRIKYYKNVGNIWTGPFNVFEKFACPALSNNDSIIYMQKDLNGVACTYYSVRNSTGWSTPTRLVSSEMQTHYYQETQLKNYYVASTPEGNSDICKLIINNKDTSIQSLRKPINTSVIENDFFIARDESYLIFFQLFEPYDLFISFKKANGGWTNPKSLGTNINTSEYECCPYVTSDNKYLFFTRGGNSMNSYYTYWIKVDELFNNLKHSNFVPYLKTNIPDQIFTMGQSSNFQISDTTFIDDDGNNSLTFTASQSNGSPLPAWLSFNPVTRSFTGTPNSSETLTIKVTVIDAAKESVTCNFNLIVTKSTGVNEDKNQIHEGYSLNQNYPNPFNPVTTIEYYIGAESFVQLKIFNVLGQEIKTLVNEKIPAGKHTVNFSAEDLNSGLYFYQIKAGNYIQSMKMILNK